MDFVSKMQLLAPAPFPNDDPASIKGSASTEQKRLSANVFAWHIANIPGSRVFGHHEFKDMKLTEINIWKMSAGEAVGLLEETVSPEAARRMSLRGQTVCELTVTEGTLSIVNRWRKLKGANFYACLTEMLNVHRTFAGGCSAHLVDMYVPSATTVVGVSCCRE